MKSALLVPIFFIMVPSLAFSSVDLFDFFFSHKKLDRVVKEKLNKAIVKHEAWPKSIEIGEANYDINYTFNKELTAYIKKLLRRFRTDYTSVVVIDNNNGHILTALDYKHRGRKFGNKLTLSHTHPAASLIKIITTAELLQNSRVSPDSIFAYRGKGTTLYRYQLRNKRTRWQRYLSLERAFAFSNNVVFGKAAIKNIVASSLLNMGHKFGFNEIILNEIPSSSILKMPRDQYNLAEIASGLNAETLMGPIHGAMISSIMANNGVKKYPRLVHSVIDQETQYPLWINRKEEKKVISQEISIKLKDMMQLAAEGGTARRFFGRSKSRVLRKLVLGGKTGSMTGGVPYGKRDWFTAFALPKKKMYGKGISVCVMIINLKKWHTRSPYIVRKIFEYYFKRVRPLNT